MVETASPVRNIVALYEKCLLHLTRARKSLAAGQPLHESYQMILAQLSLANSGNSPEALGLAEKWLAGLLEAWQGIAPGGKKTGPGGKYP